MKDPFDRDPFPPTDPRHPLYLYGHSAFSNPETSTHAPSKRVRREWNEHFVRSIEPFMLRLRQSLNRLQSKDWGGYRFEATATWDGDSGTCQIRITFRDAISQRTRNQFPSSAGDLVADLHTAFRNFDEQMEWRHLSIVRTWNPPIKDWQYQTRFTFGRTSSTPETDRPGAAEEIADDPPV